ncbi:hypothetical protein JOJ86_005925 [Rhodococcus percolatus]|uniref:hypothetical protein n=1 Tax=Rhodococcus opacus TaxID=37919 RepID=UPI0015FC13B6|nr:hypothetical protein [Rhodococcus opacus]MBA8964647.1 hypothetical protein [Rhodococcus opacus]MBP2208199.1 hypothetical protein [Rhodococcus opacus]
MATLSINGADYDVPDDQVVGIASSVLDALDQAATKGVSVFHMHSSDDGTGRVFFVTPSTQISIGGRTDVLTVLTDSIQADH